MSNGHDSRIVWVTHSLPVSLQLVIHSYCLLAFSQVLVNLPSPVSPLEQTETSSMWPTVKWVVLLYIATGHAWHYDVMHSCIILLFFQCSELFVTYTVPAWSLHVLLLCAWPLFKNESDCPDYRTERYTVDVDGVQVADMTADAVQSLAINHANGSATLSLLLSQPLPENAETLIMTKFNTVPTNRSDDMGKIVTGMVTWGTSVEFGELELENSFLILRLYMYVL